jgi:nucleoside-diphosphate-sugar epimerase
MQELATKVAGIVGVDASIVHAPLPTDDPMQRMPDATLAGRILGWSAQVPLDKGLEQTVNWFQEQYGNDMAGSP